MKAALQPDDMVRRREMAYRAFVAVTDCWLGERDIDADEQAELLLLGLQDFVGEAMRAIYCDLTHEQSDGNKLRYLLQIPESEPIWKRAVRTGLGLVGVRTRYRPPILLRPDRDICTFHRCPVSDAYSRVRKVTPVSMAYGDWFERGDRIDDGGCSGLDAETAGVLEAALRAAYEAAMLTRSVIFDQVLDRFRILARRIDYHRSTLRLRSRNLPKEFWAGTMGYVLNRIYARRVAQIGGTVVGFDHGCSSGMWLSDFQVRIEFPFLRRFVTFGPAMVDGLRANVAASRIPSAHVDIQWLSPKYPRTNDGRAKPGWKRVMYIAAAYAGHTFHSPFLYENDCMIEWQRRLLRALTDLVGNVSIKPHPESRQDVAQRFHEELRVDVLQGRFESLKLDGAVAVFDSPESSSFRDALLCGMPIVIIDLPRLTIQPQARAALAQRVALMPAWIDDDGRIQTQWSDLRRSLDQAVLLAANTSAARDYFGVNAEFRGLSRAA